MWSAFRALAARIGLSAEEIARVEQQEEPTLVQDPLNPLVQIKVRPDPDWTKRLGEAWNGTLVNSRRVPAGTLPIGNGKLAIANGDSATSETSVNVKPGQYDVILTVAHAGNESTDDYEEHISHAFALLQGVENVASISPLTDEAGLELGVIAYLVSFAGEGVLKDIAGDHAGRWSLRLGELFHPRSAEGDRLNLKSVRVENSDGSGAAILFHAGHCRDDYPLFRIADAEGNTVGVMADFFVDNRP